MLDLDNDDVPRLYWTKSMEWWVVAVDLMVDLDYGLDVWIGLGYQTLLDKRRPLLGSLSRH